jgi:2-amino-4-hydroxy-6-hydroxymethyldihydropteridine diphosphokinase
VADLRYWLGLGTNLGDRAAALQRAVDRLADGVAVQECSSVYETAARDLEDQPAFLNAVIRVATDLDPLRVLDLCKEVERREGRSTTVRFGPREIDCDVLLWEGGTWHDRRLTIPHPRLHQRRFALLPLLEIGPELALPDGRALADLEARIDPADQPARRVRGPLTIAR